MLTVQRISQFSAMALPLFAGYGTMQTEAATSHAVTRPAHAEGRPAVQTLEVATGSAETLSATRSGDFGWG